MTPTLRTLALWLAATAVAAFGGASVASYRPNGATDRARAVESLKRALASLDDEALDSAARLVAYRDGLTRTDALLRRALRTSPTDTTSIEHMATVRWESGVLAGDPNTASVSSLMEIAAARDPRVPEIQADLGELAYKMGSPDKAELFLKRAVELSPSMTNRAVATMEAAGVAPSEIVGILPRVPEVMVAVKDLFLASGEGPAYLDHVERQLGDAPPSLLMVYGEACLQLRVPARLRDRVIALPSTDDPLVQAERSCQTAHAWLSLGDPDTALGPADDARRIAPFDPRLMEFYGEVALASGHGADAEAAFRRSLELVLIAGAQPARRARLYDALGRSLEAQGRPDFAYDAFRRAVALDPAARNAAARVASYEHRSSRPPR
jgi:tetratricopeptide (TPR) repeat protein